MAEVKRKLIPGKGFDKTTGGITKWTKLSNAKLRASILAGLKEGWQLDAVCMRSGVTVRQVQYRCGHDAGFKAAYGRALLAGKAVRDMDPDAAALFLVACKWLCSLDVAREAVGLDRAQLANVFAQSPEFKREALAAFKAGRVLQDDGQNGVYTFADFGRIELAKLARRAQAMELLGEIPLNV